MERVAKFEKVSFHQFEADWKKTFGEADSERLKDVYEAVKLPQRATAGSAGYDICSPADFTLAPGEEILMPTGLRVHMQPGYVMLVFPRSGLGFRYRLQMNNTVGIIDSDYYGTANEGHIFCKLINDGRQGKTLQIRAGDGMLQGIFLAYGLTEDDTAEGIRKGGLGSTGGPKE